MKDRFDRCIEEIVTKDRCEFYDKAIVNKIIKVFNETESKDREYWLKTLVKLVGRIKDDKHGTLDPTNKDGKKVVLPFGRKKTMAIFYKNKPERRYLIYDFKITNR